MSRNCAICQWVTELPTSPFLIKEFSTGYAVLSKYQYNKGYVLFLYKKHITELHQLKDRERKRFLYEMSLVAKAIFKTVKPAKMNYELLGNTEPHLHWHLIPRYRGEKFSDSPVWLVKKNIRQSKKYMLSEKGVEVLRSKILKNLDGVY
jgi:diadenosine tetraphosphate (Ap4A) HIT family hydrolase